MLRFDQESAEYVFTGVDSEPVPSLLRGFSAPVKMDIEGQTEQNLGFLLAHDTGAAAGCYSLWVCMQLLSNMFVSGCQ